MAAEPLAPGVGVLAGCLDMIGMVYLSLKSVNDRLLNSNTGGDGRHLLSVKLYGQNTLCPAPVCANTMLFGQGTTIPH